MEPQPQPTQPPAPPAVPPAYEPPDEARAASASPTERELAYETPSIKPLDYSPAPPEHDPYAALRYNAYRLYAASFICAIIGGQVQSVALAWQIYQKTNSPLSLGYIGGIQVIPLFLLALPAGHLSDVISRKKILIVTQWLLAFWGLVFAYLAQFHFEAKWFVPAMYGGILLNAITLVFARPARSALLPQLVPANIFSNAVTWNASSFETSSVLGPAIGGYIVARGGASQGYLLNAALLVACAILTTQLPSVPVERREGETPGFRSLVAGVSFVFTRKLLLATMTLDLFAVLLGGAVYLLPVFAKDILHVGAWGFGWLRAAPSMGAITMALVLAHRPPMKKAGRALLLAVCGFGIVTLIFGLSKSFALSFAMLVLTGMFDNISVVVRHTLVQLLTPNAMRGRVSAVNQIFIGSSNELGGMESGLTAAWWGPITSVVFGGIGTLVTVVLVAIWSPELRRFGKLDQAGVDEGNHA